MYSGCDDLFFNSDSFASQKNKYVARWEAYLKMSPVKEISTKGANDNFQMVGSFRNVISSIFLAIT